MGSRKLDNYGIVISAYELPAGQSETAYLDAVEANVNLIAKYVTGQAVLQKIKAHGSCVIVPYTAEFARKNDHGDCNAVSIILPQRRDSSRLVAQVAYSPAIYGPKSRCSKTPGHRAPDVVLLHELVHTGRKLGLDYNRVPLYGSLSGYENVEEYYAILVANIYTSESKRQAAVGFRSDHGDGELLPPDDDPKVFLSNINHLNLVGKYCDQHPKISKIIATADAQFNPIKVYYDWDGKLPTAPVVRP